jgi:hypothetical protein
MNISLDGWHRDFIYNLASIVRPKVYVELGLNQCNLFNRIIPCADKLVGVDMNKNAGHYMIKSSKVRFFHGTTQKFAEELKTHPLQIDMLFIDADHSKDAVLLDFRSFFHLSPPHGLVLFHDTHPGNKTMMHPSSCGTAYQAIEELSKKTDTYEMMTIPVSPGLTICRKRQKQLSWHEKK